MQQAVQYYDHIKQTLEHPWRSKILKILEHGCLKKVNSDLWFCDPISGYNKRSYALHRNQTGFFSCNCQGYKKRGTCSHSEALRIELRDADDMKQGTFF